MSPLKLVCLKFSIPMVLLLVIHEVLCLSMGSPPHGLVGSTGGRSWKRVFTFMYILFLEHLNAFLCSLRTS